MPVIVLCCLGVASSYLPSFVSNSAIVFYLYQAPFMTIILKLMIANMTLVNTLFYNHWNLTIYHIDKLWYLPLAVYLSHYPNDSLFWIPLHSWGWRMDHKSLYGSSISRIYIHVLMHLLSICTWMPFEVLDSKKEGWRQSTWKTHWINTHNRRY